MILTVEAYRVVFCLTCRLPISDPDLSCHCAQSIRPTGVTLLVTLQTGQTFTKLWDIQESVAPYPGGWVGR